MRKFLAGLVVGAVLATGVTSMAVNQQVKLIVNGKEIVSDVSPQMINGRTMVPARPLAEALGAKVAWDQSAYAVTVTTTPQSATAAAVATEPVWVAYPDILNTLQSKYPGAKIGASTTAIRIDGTEYPFSVAINNGQRQADVSALLGAGVLNTADIQ